MSLVLLVLFLGVLGRMFVSMLAGLDLSCVSVSVDHNVKLAGNAAFLYEGGSYTFPVSARMLYGEIMIPVYDFSVGETTEIWNGNWEESTRTITIRVSDPIPPIS